LSLLQFLEIVECIIIENSVSFVIGPYFIRLCSGSELQLVVALYYGNIDLKAG